MYYSLNISIDPSHPPPKGSALACTVHVKYMRSTHSCRATPPRHCWWPTFREAWAQSDPSSTTFFSQKKFNDSAPTSIDRAHTCWWTRTEQRRKCEAEKKTHSNFEDFWESHLITIFACQSPQYWKKYPFRIYFHVMSQPGFLEGCFRQVLS